MKYAIAFILLLVSPTFAGNSTRHEFYVSITDMVYVFDAKAIQVSIKMFTDDLEFALEEDQMREVALNVDQEEALVVDYIRQYVFDHLRVYLNDQRIAYSWVGREYQNDVTWCFLEVLGVDRFNEIRVENTLLFEIYANQANMLNLTAGGETQSFIFTRNNPENTFFIKEPFKDADDIGNVKRGK